MNDTDRTTTEEPSSHQGAQGAREAPGTRPPLRRRRDDRIIAGVASGLAAYLNIDPALARIAFVVLLFANGVGLPLYIAGWLLLPEADSDETAAHELVRSKGPGFWIGMGILLLVALGVADATGFGSGNWWPLVLIAAGVALWRAGQRPPDAGATARPPDGTGASGTAPLSPTTQETAVDPSSTSTMTIPPPAGTAPATPPPGRPREPVAFEPPPVPSRRPNLLARITVALAFITAGVTVVLDRLDVVDAHIGHVLAAALVVVGVGMVVGAWFGRARPLIVPGLVLVPMVLLTGLFQAADVPWDAGFGERVVRIEAASDVPTDGYRLAAGQLSIRLDGLPRDAGRIEITAEVGAGQIDVRVPSDAEVRVRGRTGAGDLQLFDRNVSGVGAIEENVVQEGEPGSPVIVLDLRTGVGQIVVQSRGETTAPTS